MANYTVIGVGQHKKFFDKNSYYDATNYIFDPEHASHIGGAGVSCAENAAQEMAEVTHHFGKDKGKKLRHSVLSFDEHEHINPEQANEYAQQIIQHYAPEYQIVYAVHDNTENVHIHMIMNHISHVDGHRYGGKKKDYYDFKHHMGRVTHLPIILVKDQPFEG